MKMDTDPPNFQGVLFDGRWIGAHGIGRFSSEVIKRLPGSETLKEGRSFFLSPLDPFWSACMIHRKCPRVYFTPGYNPPAFSSIPVVMMLHDLIHLKIAEERSVAKTLYYDHFVKPALFRAFRVLTCSETSKKDILSWSGISEEKVIVTGHGIAPEFCPEGPRHSPGFPYFLYVGNRKPHKNLPLLFESFSRARFPKNFRLLLSGNPDPSTRSDLKSFGIDDRVLFLGVISDEDIPSVYRGATALLFPSRMEGFGLPVLEAMACGSRVIAARIPAVEEVAGTSAILLPLEDPGAWSKAMEEVAESGGDQGECWNGERVSLSESDRIRRMGVVHAQSFSWDQVASRIGEVLLDAMRKV